MNNPSIPPSIGEGVVPPSPFDLSELFDREHALHCFACGGAIGTRTCTCAGHQLSRAGLASALEWARRDALVTPPFPDNALREALEALEPFAELCENFVGEDEDDADLYRPPLYESQKHVTVGSLRRAVKALAALNQVQPS